MSETLTRPGHAPEHAVGTIDQIPRGEGRTFAIQGRRIAVFRTHADQVFATQADCPHANGPLADGMMGGTTIMCPLHDRSYDLRTGQALVGECGIEVYPVRTDPAGVVTITLP